MTAADDARLRHECGASPVHEAPHDQYRWVVRSAGGDPAIRLDRFISDQAIGITRSQLDRRLIGATVNGKPAKLGQRVVAGDVVVITCLPAPHPLPPISSHERPAEGGAGSLDVLFENDDVLVIDKPSGLVVHPGAGNHATTVVHELLKGYLDGAEWSAWAGTWADGYARPGIVHRLDKDTSGVLIVAKHPRAHEFLSDQFRRRAVHKHYVAVVSGRLATAAGRLDTLLARHRVDRKRYCVATTGKRAVTVWRRRTVGDGFSVVDLLPSTGRTHQLRVHMQYIGHPILGDPVYGKNAALAPSALLLHAWRLAIRLPGVGTDDPMVFEAQLPERFQRFVSSAAAADAPPADGGAPADAAPDSEAEAGSTTAIS